MFDYGFLSRKQYWKGRSESIRQAGALCYRFNNGRPEVLLITTRRSGRWIIPKGRLIAGLSVSGTALQEAWEEAGVQGRCAADLLGQFTYVKHRAKKGAVLCVVDVCPLLVHSTASSFPEAGQRRRKWFSPKKAANKVKSPELAALLRKVEQFVQ